MKAFISLSLCTLLVLLGPVSASADNLNWAVWPGKTPDVGNEKVDPLPESDLQTDALVEAGLDDSPAAPATDGEVVAQPDASLAADAVSATPDEGALSSDEGAVSPEPGISTASATRGVPEPTIVANATEVLAEFETSGQANEKVEPPPESDLQTDALVEAGLDDSPAAPAAEEEVVAQPDAFLAADAGFATPDEGALSSEPGISTAPETRSAPEPAIAANAAEVLEEFETSGQPIDEPGIDQVSVVEMPVVEIAEESPAITTIATDSPVVEDAAITIPEDKSSADLLVASEVVPEDQFVPADEIVPVIEDTPAGDVVVVADSVVDSAADNDTDKAAANGADAVIDAVPTIEPQLVITPVPSSTPHDEVDATQADDLALTRSDDTESNNETAEDAALAAIEAEVNDSLVLGPVAIADDLADAADGAEAVAEDATGASSTMTADATTHQPGRYDEVMSEIIKADQIDGADKPSNTDQPAPLLLEQVLELALTNNPEVAMALAREEQARWGVREAGGYRSPTVDMAVEFGPERNRPATKSSDIDDITPGRNLNLRISKLLYDGGVSVAEENRRMQIRRTTEIETRLVIEEVVTKAIKSYMEILQNQQAARVAEDFVAEMQRMVNQISQMHESGAASKIELDFAKSRLASARAQTGNSAAQLNDALSNLEFLTGDLAEFTAVAPIDVSTVAVDTLLNYIEAARNNNAEVLLNASNKTALSLKIRGQQAGYSPILSINFKTEALQDEGGNSDAHTTSEIKLKAEYFLIDGGVRKARIQRSKAQLMELAWDHERLVKDIDRRIKQSYNQITTNRLTLAATEDEIKANQELRRLNRQNLEIGDISILELIEVEERLFNSQATWHRISSEMLRNYYDLLIGVGDLPAVLVQDYTTSRIAE
jgi:outer membrane protein, adhesin transport system